jgi:hypothetical protein
VQRDRQARNKSPKTGVAVWCGDDGGAGEGGDEVRDEYVVPFSFLGGVLGGRVKGGEVEGERGKGVRGIKGGWKANESRKVSYTDDSYEAVERRRWAATILDCPELLMMHAQARQDVRLPCSPPFLILFTFIPPPTTLVATPQGGWTEPDVSLWDDRRYLRRGCISRSYCVDMKIRPVRRRRRRREGRGGGLRSEGLADALSVDSSLGLEFRSGLGSLELGVGVWGLGFGPWS